MFAIIHTGGKQYLVREGMQLKFEKLDGNAGDSVQFADVYLVADEQKGTVLIGNPTLSGAHVEGTIDEHGRGKKITIIKFKPKVRYKRKQGHRQAYTGVTIKKIVAA